MTAWPLALALVAPWAGHLSDRFSAGLLGTIGLAALAGGLTMLIFMPAQPSAADVLWRMALCGFGFGLFQTPNSRAMVAGSPTDRTGAASALQSAARLFGQTLGAALVATLFGRSPDTAATNTLHVALACAVAACLVSSFRRSIRE
jgi:DHA2 family multidrug resistance protein-like MFS transporter